MNMNGQDLFDELRAKISGISGINLVYLFGSRLSGNIGPMSDYDLAVLVESLVDAEQVIAELSHAAAIIFKTDRIDVVPLSHAPVELAYAIIAHGECIFQKDTATRVEYEAQVLSMYGDYLPVLRAHREDILRGDDHGRRVQRYRDALGRTERTIGEIRSAKRKAPG
jgi:predicted nucleotidyltransferase